MKQKTITLSYDELFLLWTEARSNDYRLYASKFEGELDEFDEKLKLLYEKLEKKYNWKK